MKIAIVNSMKGVDREVGLMLEASQIFDREVTDSYSQPDPFGSDSMTYAAIRLLQHGEQPQTDEIPAHFDEKCDVEDAAGYHDKYSDGRPYIIVGRDASPNGELLRSDGASMLATWLHELAELKGNPKVNRWIQANYTDKKSGKVYPLVCPELCDPFQGVYDTMTLKDGTKVDRVGWAYRAFFEQERNQSKQLDSHGAASEPLQTLPGGYQIVAVIGRETSLFGARHAVPGKVTLVEHHERGLTDAQRVRKMKPSSRTMRIINSLA